MCVPIAISGSNLTKLYQATWSEAGVITCVQLLERVPPTNFGRAKNVQISARSDDFRLWVQITPELINITKIWIASDQLQPLPRWGLNIWWTLVHKQKKLYARMLTHVTGLFSGDYISAFRGAVPSNFHTPYNHLNCTFNCTWATGGLKLYSHRGQVIVYFVNTDNNTWVSFLYLLYCVCVCVCVLRVRCTIIIIIIL